MFSKKKLFTLFFLTLLFSNSVFSQVYGKVLQFRPTGVFGFIANKTISGEIGYLEEFDSPFRFRAYLNFANYTPRMDVFPGVGYSNIDGTDKFYPGTDEYRRLMNGILGAGWDFSPDFFEDFRIRPYIGLDMNIGYHIRETHFYNPVISDLTETGAGIIAGIKGRFGAQYAFKNSGVFIDIARTYSIIVPYAFTNYNDLGIGFYYNF